MKIMNKLAKVFGPEIWDRVFKDLHEVGIKKIEFRFAPQLQFIIENFPKLSKEDQNMFIDWMTFKAKQMKRK